MCRYLIIFGEFNRERLKLRQEALRQQKSAGATAVAATPAVAVTPSIPADISMISNVNTSTQLLDDETSSTSTDGGVLAANSRFGSKARATEKSSPVKQATNTSTISNTVMSFEDFDDDSSYGR